jgi:hypothetical protein
VPDITIGFPFHDVHGREHVLHANSVEGREWHLHASLDGVTFSRRCSDWQRVERALRWLRAHAHERTEPAKWHATASRAVMVVALIAASMLVAAPGFAQEQPAEPDGIARFLRAADDYTQLHRRLEQLQPPLVINADPATLRRAIDALAAAIRAERREAAEGDLFNADARRFIRARIGTALRGHGLTAVDVLAAESAQGIDPGEIQLRINGPFPWVIATAMFPCVLHTLPPLPPELTYRMVGHDLVLIDVHAGLVVDILRLALVDPGTVSSNAADRNPPVALPQRQELPWEGSHSSYISSSAGWSRWAPCWRKRSRPRRA